MKIIYSDLQRHHRPRWEWNFGRNVPYPEKNQRISVIVKAMKNAGFGDNLCQPKPCSSKHLLKVHDRRMVQHIRSCRDMPEGRAVHAHIFPYRHIDPHPGVDMKKAGFYCFDVGTSINRHTFDAAKSAVDCAVDGARRIIAGKERTVFALCRPPGHHADFSMYGGYCYFNNAAIAASLLAESGKVAILDLDFHHGNGTQSIFYQMPYVYFVSIHGDPKVHYPYFCGFASEKGEYLGLGANSNYPLPSGVDDQGYQRVLERALKRIRAWKPRSLIVSMGFDTFEEDPAGDFQLTSDFFGVIGDLLQRQPCPILICMEGGYVVKELGRNATNFALGLTRKD